MSNIVPAFSTIRVTLTAGQAVAVWSKGAFKVTQVNSYINAPPANAELVDRVAGSLQYQSSAFTSGATVDIDAYGGLPAFYEQGTVATVKEGRALAGTQIASTAVNASATVTSAELLNGRITSTSTSAPTDLTLPTGTLLYAATSWLPGEFLEWTITNTGANILNVLAGTDHTIVGGNGAAIVVPTLTAVTLRTTLVSVSGAVGTFVTKTEARAIS